VLFCPGDNFAIPYDSEPVGDDVLSVVGGHLDVYSPSIMLEVGWHFGVPVAVPNAVDLGFVGVYCSGELVDVAVGFGEPLVSEGGVLVYCGDEAICNGMCGVSEVVVLHAEDGFSQARGYWGVVTDAVGGNVYAEQGW